MVKEPSPLHTPDQGDAPATPRQLQAIGRIARAKGLDPGAVEGMSLRAFNRRPDALTTGEASALIRELSTMRRVAA